MRFVRSRRFWYVLIPIFIVAVIVSGLLIIPNSAQTQAQTPIHSLDQAPANVQKCAEVSGYQHCTVFNFTWTFNTGLRDTGNGCCATEQYYFTGHVGFNRTFKALPSQTTIWLHITILKPVLTAIVSICPSQGLRGDRGKADMDALTMSALWQISNTVCSFNPSYTASIP